MELSCELVNYTLKLHKIQSVFCLDYKMYFPQVWSIRNCGEKGWSLCSAAQHHQREDLCLPLVLVLLPAPVLVLALARFLGIYATSRSAYFASTHGQISFDQH